jgi:hypothetical protein
VARSLCSLAAQESAIRIAVLASASLKLRRTGSGRILDLGSRSRLPGFFFSRIGFCVQKEAARAQKAILRRRAARLCMQFALGFALRRPCRHAPVVYQPGAPRRNRVGIGGLLKTSPTSETGRERREKGEAFVRFENFPFCLLPSPLTRADFSAVCSSARKFPR